MLKVTFLARAQRNMLNYVFVVYDLEVPRDPFDEAWIIFRALAKSFDSESHHELRFVCSVPHFLIYISLVVMLSDVRVRLCQQMLELDQGVHGY